MIEAYARIANLILENLFDKSVGLQPEDHTLPAKHYRRDILNQIAAAKKSGKPFAWGREGNVVGRDRERLAQRIADRLGVEMKGFNLEHPKTDIERNKSLTMRKLKRMTGSRAGARGVRHAFLGGQGNSRYRTDDGDKYLRSQGIDPNDKKAMYKASFDQEDFGAKKLNPINRGQQTINKIRRAGVKRSISDMQKQGYYVGGTFGEGHFKKEKK